MDETAKFILGLGAAIIIGLVALIPFINEVRVTQNCIDSQTTQSGKMSCLPDRKRSMLMLFLNFSEKKESK